MTYVQQEQQWNGSQDNDELQQLCRSSSDQHKPTNKNEEYSILNTKPIQ